MKKLGRKIFMVVSILFIALALTINVKAAQEDTYGYEDFDQGTTTSTEQGTTTSTEQGTTNTATENQKEDTKSNTETPAQTTTETKTETETNTKSNEPNTATTAHAQAGAFENSLFVAATVILALSIGFGYKKFKKYNF